MGRALIKYSSARDEIKAGTFDLAQDPRGSRDTEEHQAPLTAYWMRKLPPAGHSIFLTAS